MMWLSLTDPVKFDNELLDSPGSTARRSLPLDNAGPQLRASARRTEVLLTPEGADIGQGGPHGPFSPAFDMKIQLEP